MNIASRSAGSSAARSVRFPNKFLDSESGAVCLLLQPRMATRVYGTILLARSSKFGIHALDPLFGIQQTEAVMTHTFQMRTRRQGTCPSLKARGVTPTWLGVLLAILVIQAPPLSSAFAALGELAESIENDRAAMKGEGHSKPGKGYSLETITTAGLTITEYVSSDGVVFAVTWKGTGAPDLRLLFGPYFDEYQEGLIDLQHKKPRSKKPLMLKTAHLVIERVGSSRSMWGRAFVPALVPPAISLEDIR